MHIIIYNNSNGHHTLNYSLRQPKTLSSSLYPYGILKTHKEAIQFND